MNISGSIANQLNNLDQNSVGNVNATQDYLGSVKILEKAGFSPFIESSPLKSTLYRIFDRFVQKTGIDTTGSQLKDEYLEKNPPARRAVNLYNALENTFASRGNGEKARIVDFLNSQIDEYVSSKDSNSDTALTGEESGLSETLFAAMDSNRDSKVNAQEMRKNFYNNFTEMNYALDYFQNNRGVLVDIYG